VSDRVADPANKSRAFAMVSAINSVGAIGGVALAFFCLRMHMENYLSPWLGLAVTSVIVLALLAFAVPETYPAELHRPVTKTMLNPVDTFYTAFHLFLRDKVLVGLAIINFFIMFHFLGFLLTTFSFLILVGFAEEQTVLPGVVGSLAQIVCSLIVVGIMPRIGVWVAFIAGNCMFVVTYFFWGPFTILVGPAGPFLANVTQAAAFALFAPAMQTIVSERVEVDNQSKCFAFLSSVSALGGIFGTPFYSLVLFDGTAQGLGRAVPALASAFLAVVCVVMSVRLAMLAQHVEPFANCGKAADLEALSGEHACSKEPLCQEVTPRSDCTTAGTRQLSTMAGL
jgi:MFS family permease